MGFRNPRLSLYVHPKRERKVLNAGVVPLSEYLWNQTLDIRNATLATYFVQGIGDGKLDPTAFGGYMVQDSVYCYSVKNTIDVAVDRADDGELKEYLKHESGSYANYYKDLFGKWHIKDPRGIDLSPACQAYSDYEAKVASEMDTIYMIVAMIPCQKLWPWLGRELEKQSTDHGVYTAWFDGNFNPTYGGYKELDAFVDDAGDTIDREKALVVYTKCMQGEFGFFNSAQAMRLGQ